MARPQADCRCRCTSRAGGSGGRGAEAGSRRHACTRTCMLRSSSSWASICVAPIARPLLRLPPAPLLSRRCRACTCSLAPRAPSAPIPPAWATLASVRVALHCSKDMTCQLSVCLPISSSVCLSVCLCAGNICVCLCMVHLCWIPEACHSAAGPLLVYGSLHTGNQTGETAAASLHLRVRLRVSANRPLSVYLST